MKKLGNRYFMRQYLFMVILLICCVFSQAAMASKVLEFEKTRDIGEGQFNGLTGICVFKDQIYACDSSSVKVFDKDGKILYNWTAPSSPTCIAVDEKGFVYVAGSDGKISKFSSDNSGKLLISWGESGSGEGQIAGPSGIAVYKDFVLVSDSKNRCVHKYKTDGKFQMDIGREKGKNGIFSTCCGILDFCVDNKGDIYVANLGAHRVESCNIKGRNTRHWGKAGKSDEDFCGCCNPTNIAVAGNGNIITTEKTIPRVKIYSPRGRKLLAIMGVGAFDKSCANMDVAVDSNSNIYVVDNKANCIRVFSSPQKTTEK